MSVPSFNIRVNTQRLSAYAILAFLVGTVLGGALWNFGGVYVTPPDTIGTFGSMLKFTDYDDMTNFLETRRNGGHQMWFEGDGVFAVNSIVPRGFSAGGDAVLSIEADDAVSAAVQAAAAASEAKEASSGITNLVPDMDAFSGTNVQVEGVDEADIVKTDGEYIYLTKNQTVVIIRAYPADEAEIVHRLNIGSPVQNLYIAGDKMVVFSHRYPSYYDDVIFEILPSDKDRTTITIFDISDRADPVKEQEVTLDGYYFSSRMIGDWVYFIVNSPAYIEDEEIILPIIREGRTWCEVQPTDIFYFNDSYGYQIYNTLMALNVQDSDAKAHSETFLLNQESSLYVSLDNMYIVSGGWSENSTITKINVNECEITYVAEGSVPGRILNQFSMDEYDGVFRVATTSWSRNLGQINNVYTLDEKMEVIGRLEGLAPNESIYSARFMGDRCYLVTFKKVDPLFTIDLSDPYNPKVLGKLKIPGFSNYLHPYDENIVIGVGKETEEAKTGDFAWHQGVKISMFDVSDVTNPRELAKIVIGDRGTESPAQYDHKAFLFSKERNLLVIPILETGIDEEDYVDVPPNMYGELLYQGAYVFDISPEGIELRGKVTHIDDPDYFLKSGYWFDSQHEITRSLYIYENLYTLSKGRLQINNLETLEELKVIELNEGDN
jgi:inhibitor of cysteine peptidase